MYSAFQNKNPNNIVSKNHNRNTGSNKCWFKDASTLSLRVVPNFQIQRWDVKPFSEEDISEKRD